jgi:hypothetical protein
MLPKMGLSKSILSTTLKMDRLDNTITFDVTISIVIFVCVTRVISWQE